MNNIDFESNHIATINKITKNKAEFSDKRTSCIYWPPDCILAVWFAAVAVPGLVIFPPPTALGEQTEYRKIQELISSCLCDYSIKQ
jgi:hypothetical protein